ncbi:hypothetical protein BJ878DRAFT_488542 [Calycina marina]|uniref:Uncharacterized protein n=1 Tax=Calycina marina TaxID=1763456 RepID=A0A9P7ZBD8_9HELO|nr:hypothetical protein BJ878DRAFT_488542 [Calycina marina]
MSSQSAYAKNTKVSEEANELMEGSTPDSPPFEDTVPINSQSAFASVSFSHGGGANGKAGTPDFGAPGSSYNNKKANEEFLRAMSSLVDRDTDAHKKFGDVLMRKQ